MGVRFFFFRFAAFANRHRSKKIPLRLSANREAADLPQQASRPAPVLPVTAEAKPRTPPAIQPSGNPLNWTQAPLVQGFASLSHWTSYAAHKAPELGLNQSVDALANRIQTWPLS
jgi:hypothetical protein